MKSYERQIAEESRNSAKVQRQEESKALQILELQDDHKRIDPHDAWRLIFTLVSAS